LNDISLDAQLSNVCSRVFQGTTHRDFDLNLYVSKISQMNHLARIVLYRNSLNLNDEIYKHLPIRVRHFSNNNNLCFIYFSNRNIPLKKNI